MIDANISCLRHFLNVKRLNESPALFGRVIFELKYYNTLSRGYMALVWVMLSYSKNERKPISLYPYTEFQSGSAGSANRNSAFYAVIWKRKGVEIWAHYVHAYVQFFSQTNGSVRLLNWSAQLGVEAYSVDVVFYKAYSKENIWQMCGGI